MSDSILHINYQHFHRPDRGQRARGQTLIEFAFVSTLFFVLLFGTIEFSRALWTWNTIVQATRAGARFAVVENPNLASGNIMAVKRFVVYHDPSDPPTRPPVVPGLTTSNVTVQYLKNDGTDASSNKFTADVIQVSVTGYSFNFLVPILGGTLTLPSFTTTLKLEGLGAT